MHPILFTLPDGFPLLGGSPIASYGVLLGLSLLLGWALAHRRLVADGLSEGFVVALLACTLVAGLLGARGLHLAASSEAWRGWRSLLRFDAAGNVFWGAMLVGGAAAGMMARLRRAPVWRVLDRLAPSVALGLALTNVGVFLHGDVYGEPTESPLGVTYPLWSADDALALGQPGPAVVMDHLRLEVEPVFGHVLEQSRQMRGLARSPVARGNPVLTEAPAAFEAKVQSLATLAGWPRSAPVVPSPLLGAAVGALVFFGLLVFERRRHVDGQLALALVVFLGVGNVAVGATRADPASTVLGGLSFTQTVGLGLFAAAAVLWLWRSRRAARREGPGGDGATENDSRPTSPTGAPR